MSILIVRCGIGTLSRNRSRAGSVDEGQMRMTCRSVTPSGSSSVIPFQEQIAFTLPRSFETNNIIKSPDVNNSIEGEGRDVLHNRCCKSNFSGMDNE